MKTAEGKEENEYIIPRLDNTIPSINLVNTYGSHESRSKKDDIEKVGSD